MGGGGVYIKGLCVMQPMSKGHTRRDILHTGESFPQDFSSFFVFLGGQGLSGWREQKMNWVNEGDRCTAPVYGSPPDSRAQSKSEPRRARKTEKPREKGRQSKERLFMVA